MTFIRGRSHMLLSKRLLLADKRFLSLLVFVQNDTINFNLILKSSGLDVVRQGVHSRAARAPEHSRS